MNESGIDLTELHNEWSTTDESSEEGGRRDVNVAQDECSTVAGSNERESHDEVQQGTLIPSQPICSAYTKWNRRCCLHVEEGGEFCKRHKKMKFNTCDICYGNMYCETKLACNHSFCTNCIYKWSNKGDSCPICRKVMFYVNHSREVKIRRATDMIYKADHLLSVDGGFDEKFMTEVLEYLLENEWLESFDRQYKNILENYTSYCLVRVEGDKRKMRKFNNFKNIVSNL